MGFIRRYWVHAAAVLVWCLFAALIVLVVVPARRLKASSVQTGVVSQIAQGSLSSAQILALTSASGLTLFSGGGPGTVVFVDSWTLESSTAGTAYSGGSGLKLSYAVSGLQASAQIPSTTLTGNPILSSEPAFNLAPQPPSDFTNQGIQLILVGAAFTGGTATLSYWIQYHVLGGF